MNPIDRTSPVPLYYQLKRILMEKIERSDWNPGDLIPSELELQEMYNLSRTTVRQTLSELVTEGYLLRQRGRGTFIARPKIAHDPANWGGVSEFMRQQGLEPGWQVLEQGVEEASDEAAMALGVEPGAPIMVIKRLRLANHEPIGFHVACLNQANAVFIDQEALNNGVSSLAYLAGHPQMDQSRAQRTIEAIGAADEEVKWLGMVPGAPVLHIQRIVSSATGEPLEYLSASYRGDRFKYQITL